MIASLNGTIVALERGSAVIDVSGVGYQVLVSRATASELRVGLNTLIFTSLIVREDGFTLFGFTRLEEQRVFDLLRSVTGVGPKSAIAILGELSVTQISDAVARDNDAVFRAVSGIGPKTAKLITLTLAGKLGFSSSNSIGTSNSVTSTVIAALTGLGWNERAATDAAMKSLKQLGTAATTNELLKYSLSNLGSSKSVGASDE